MKKYRSHFSEKELKAALYSHEQEAKELLQDRDKWDSFRAQLDAFLHKADKIPVLGRLIADIVSMIQMVESYLKKEYTDVPITSIIAVVGALLYLLSPIDLIPDAIPVIGYFDDAAVILLVLNLGVGHDLDKYKEWQDDCRAKAIADLEKLTGKQIIELLGQQYLGALILEKHKFRVLAVDKESAELGDSPFPVTVFYLNLPIQLLKEMYIESENEYLDFLNGIIELSDFSWSPLGKLSAIYEADYEQYEENFALMERADTDE